MKKTIFAIIISILFLIGSIFYIILNNKQDNIVVNDMDINYVTSNFEIELYDEKVGNEIILTSKGKYIGNEKISNDVEIKLFINCLYNYTDADIPYTNVISDNITLKNIDNEFKGSLNLNIERDDINYYSCAYKIIDVSGKFSFEK